MNRRLRERSHLDRGKSQFQPHREAPAGEER